MFLALLTAAAGSRGVGDLPHAEGPDTGADRYRILWKSGAVLPDSLSSPASEARALLAGGNRRILLQFHRKPDREELRDLGVDLLRYVPKGTWIARLSDRTDWSGLDRRLRWAGPIPPEAKIAPAVGEWVTGKRAGVFSARVRFHDDVNMVDAAAVIESSGGSAIRGRAVFHGFDALITASSAEDLASRDEVLWIGAPLPPPVYANDGIRENARVDSLQAPNDSLDGTNVVAGIWDGGRIDNHTDFSGRLIVVDGASPVSDHATHVAGTLAGSGAMSVSRGGSVDQWKGVAPGCDILSYDFYGDIPAEKGSAISTYGVDLTSNSWVLDVDEVKWNNCYFYGDYDGYAPEFDAVVTGYFGKRITIVAAAGNERNDGDCSIDARSGYACIPPPGTAKNVITVGAINTNNSTMTSFSGYGPVDDGRLKPDIVAGGCQSSYDYSIRSTWPGDLYGATYYCGTSMATPAVSGAVALVLEEWRNRDAAGPGPTGIDPYPSTLKALLVGSATDLGNPGPDFRFGFGGMNARGAVDLVRTGTVVEDSAADGAVLEWQFPVAPGVSTIKITLAWDDPAGTALSNPALVNDLDLALYPPIGSVVPPLVLDPGNPAAAATIGADHVNNVEQATVSSPVDGIWTARVTGYDVPVGTTQPFSLVGIDTLPPSAPGPFGAASPTDTTIDLVWTQPGDTDRRGVLIARSRSSITWSPAPGTLYSPGQTVGGNVTVVDTPAVATSRIDTALTPGVTWYYAAFAFDRRGNYSAPAGATLATTGGVTAVPIAGAVPSLFRLHPARPNPFNPTTRIRFDLAEDGPVRFEIYDMAGRLVRRLVDENLAAGSYEETWRGVGNRGEDVASGVYFARLTAGGKTETTRLMLVR